MTQMDPQSPHSSSQKATRSTVKTAGLNLAPPLERTNRKRNKPGIISETISEAICGEMSENVSILEQNLFSLYDQEAPSNKDILGAILDANKITSEKLKPLNAALNQINANTSKIANIEARVTTGEYNQSQLSDKVAILEQSQLQHIATITGFKSPPDPESLATALCECFGLQASEISMINSFTIKKDQSDFIITNVTLSNAIVKGKLISAKIAKGELKAKQFFPSLTSDGGANNTIYIGHKFTSNNIKIRKRLIELQKAGKITAKRFRNHRFQIQLPAQNEWHDVPTVGTLNHLLEA